MTSKNKTTDITASAQLACDSDVEAHREVIEGLVAPPREAMTHDGGQVSLVLVEDLKKRFVGLTLME